MEPTDETRLNNVIKRLHEITKAITDGQASSIAIDFQASGECPWRLTIPDEQYPVVGVALADAGSNNK